MQRIDTAELQNEVQNHSKLVGLRQVVKHLEKLGGHLGCVVVASDAEQRIKSLVEDLTQKYGVPLLEYESKAQMGQIVGIKVDCAVLGLI